MSSGVLVYGEDPEALSRFFKRFVKRYALPLAERIRQEEERMGRRLTGKEVRELIKEVSVEAAEGMGDGEKQG